MKFYTKDWYNLMQRLNYTALMKPIKDKKYSDEEIDELYKKQLQAKIDLNRRQYNQPPHFAPIDFDNCKPEDFCTFDTETGTLRHHTSIEEVKLGYEKEKAQALEQFNNRPPFDPKQTIELFKKMYDSGLKHGYLRFPDWVKDEVDIRLIALGVLPKSVYNRLKTEQEQNKAEFEKINRNAEKVLGKEGKKIPERILSKFGFHDGAVLSLEKVGEDLVMTIEEDSVPFEGETPYTQVTFTDGEIIKRDENLKFEICKFEIDGREYSSYCSWLYDELYKTEKGYEAHLLLAEKELGYLTIACSDIVIEQNINVDKPTK